MAEAEKYESVEKHNQSFLSLNENFFEFSGDYEWGDIIIHNIHYKPVLTYTYLICLILVSVLGNVGNVLVIGAVLSDKRLRKQGNLFIVNLAFADLCVTGFVNPFSIVGVFVGHEYFQQRPVLCHLIGSICLITCVCSLWSIMVISVNRYTLMCHKHLYHRIFTWRNCFLILTAIWIFSLALDIPNFLDWGDHAYDMKTMACSYDRTASYSYTAFFISMFVAIPLVTVLFCNIKIYILVTKSKIKIASYRKMNKKDRKSLAVSGHEHSTGVYFILEEYASPHKTYENGLSRQSSGNSNSDKSPQYQIKSPRKKGQYSLLSSKVGHCNLDVSKSEKEVKENIPTEDNNLVLNGADEKIGNLPNSIQAEKTSLESNSLESTKKYSGNDLNGMDLTPSCTSYEETLIQDLHQSNHKENLSQSYSDTPIKELQGQNLHQTITDSLIEDLDLKDSLKPRMSLSEENLYSPITPTKTSVRFTLGPEDESTLQDEEAITKQNRSLNMQNHATTPGSEECYRPPSYPATDGSKDELNMGSSGDIGDHKVQNNNIDMKKIHNVDKSKVWARISMTDIKLAKTLFIIFITFCICWTPYALLCLIDVNDDITKDAYIIAILMAHASSTLNSVLYATTNKRFRIGYKLFLKKCCMIKSDTTSSC